MYGFRPEYFSDYQQLSLAASKLVINHISASNSIQIGVATGQSPLKTYELVAVALWFNPSIRENISLFQLDEWMGLSAKSDQSCQKYIVEHIVKPWQIDADNCFLLDGDAIDQQDQINRMKEHLRMRPIDLCILGLGKNGHLALNEPGSLKSDPSRIVDLTDISRTHSMIKGQAEHVKKGITIGLKEILEAKEILLIVSGKDKKDVTRQLIIAEKLSGLPAAVLFDHPRCHCYIDENVLN